jgi:hypothetical protein
MRAEVIFHGSRNSASGSQNLASRSQIAAEPQIDDQKRKLMIIGKLTTQSPIR